MNVWDECTYDGGKVMRARSTVSVVQVYESNEADDNDENTLFIWHISSRVPRPQNPRHDEYGFAFAHFEAPSHGHERIGKRH